MQELAISNNHSVATNDLILDTGRYQQIIAFAEMMAKSSAMVPRHLQNKPSDCAAIVMQSVQWRMNPFAVAQKTHLINGVLGYEAQLVNAVITSLAPTKDRLHFEWYGDWSKVLGNVREATSQTKKDDEGKPKKYMVPNWGLSDEHGLGIKVWATMQGETEPRVLDLLLKQARTRNSTLWADDPRQQLAYLAIKRWSRLYCPDVIMGVYTPDELEPETEIELNPSTVTPIRPTVVQPASTKPAAPVADAEFEVVATENGTAAPESSTSAPAAEPKQTTLIPENDGEEPKVLASPNMLKIVKVKLENSGIAEADLFEMLGINSLEEMEARHVNGATKWIADETKRRAS